MSKLQGKVPAWLPASTAGIGFATAKRFVDEGAFVNVHNGPPSKELRTRP